MQPNTLSSFGSSRQCRLVICVVVSVCFLSKANKIIASVQIHDEIILSYMDYQPKLIVPLNVPESNCVKTVHFKFFILTMIKEIIINQL